MSIPVTDAIAAIQRDGFYVIKDGNVGEQVLQFDQEVKSPNGFKFLAHHSLDNPQILQIIQDLLVRPWWAFVKLYRGGILPSDYAFAFHVGPQRVALAIQLWSPGSTFVLSEGSHHDGIRKEDIDDKTSNEWGLLAARLDFPETEVTLEEGGILIADSRQFMRVTAGSCITIGYAAENMFEHIGKMKLPYSREFDETLQGLKSRGFDIRYKWEAANNRQHM